MLLTIFLLPIIVCGPDDADKSKAEFAKQVRAAYEDLDSLYFEAKVTGYEWASMERIGARGRIRKWFKVWMADGPRFRVEGFKGSELVCAVVCDGKEVTDWFPAENAYTRYLMPTFDKEYEINFRLFADKETRYFCTCWVDARGPFGAWLDEVLSSPLSRRGKPRQVAGIECDVILAESHPDISGGSFPNATTDTYTLYFDRQTHLLAQEKRSLTMVSIVASYNRSTTTYRNVQPNVELPPDIFVFKPPEGAKFIPPDDPRFKAKEIVQLTGKPAPAFSLPRVEPTRSRERASEDEAKQQADEGVRDKPQEAKPVSLADFKDKKAVLVVFWGTWCLPCQKEIPSLIKLHEELSDKGLAVIGICGGEKSEKDVREFLKKRPLPYTILYDGKQEATQAYGAKSVPYTILIDKTGTVVRVWQGWSGEEEERQLREELAKLLVGPTTAAGTPNE